jgi:hypothetical protein
MQDDIAQLTHPALSVCEMREVLPITILPESCVVFCGEAARLVVVAYWQDICRRVALPINADTPNQCGYSRSLVSSTGLYHIAFSNEHT